ncbi:NADH-quinone oxidoreductase subunit B family protein [Methylomonas sp. MED-D]|uniref:NADH-quinone oxidoreductase subunit B family protein n=1 Tax=unclassified Methylomonas TaxID=2608980 RepID=UPI001438C940|nr:NADH-quinone oxidoreductase subunit B family protein [Methylomonas sp. MV1]MDT4329376.1 NADH-quinone oxidoreductase subunit B family protein [Methylomonas sp. MV1]NJA08478.1 NADH-quinone oxidoreductase subunit B family protein [Methylococcaceae bacterium WWC4]
MLKQFKKILTTGIVTERVSVPKDAELEALGIEIKRHVDRKFSGSIAIRQVDAGSCNGCELEIHALNNPYYDIERFGIHFVASPRHADVLLVTGPVSRHMQTALIRTYQATPDPKWVVAVGDCATCGGEFGVSYASCGAVANVIPVDATIPGCPPTPLALMQGLLALMTR